MNKKYTNFNNDFMTSYVNDNPVTFKVILRDSRSVCFKIDDDKEIVLYRGKNCSDEFVNQYVLKNLLKFYKKSLAYKNHEVNAICDDYLTIFTKKYPIKIIKSHTRNTYEFLNGTIYMHLTNVKNQSKVIKKVYEDLAVPFIIQRTKYWAKRMNAVVKKILFKTMDYAFAYYRYSDNSITFSLRSLCCSLQTFDYLIIHELSHYFFHSHQAEFWKKVEEFCSNYKILDKKIKKYK